MTSDRDRYLDTILDLALKAIKTKSAAELELFLADVRFLLGAENCPVLGILKSPVTETEAEGGE